MRPDFDRFAWGPRLGAMRWPERLRALGDECWRAAQLIVFFVVAALLFSAPPRGGIFTSAVYESAAADPARPSIARASRVIDASETDANHTPVAR